MKTQIIAGLVLIIASLVGCTSSDQKEIDALSRAQQCLDEVPQNDYTSATQCLTYTTPYNSARANFLRCSIYLTAGGLTTSRMTSVYNTSQDNTISSDQKQAVYIGLLAFTDSGGDTQAAYNAALNAQQICTLSGETNFIFVANMAVLGSLTNYVYSQLPSNPASGIDFDNLSPSDINTAIQDAVSHCQSDPTDAICDMSTVATIATSTASTYCSGQNANEDVCDDVSQVLTWNTTDPETITTGLMCVLQGNTFTPPSTCN